MDTLKGEKFFQIVGYAIAGIGFFGGIAIGNQFPIISVSEYTEAIYKDFNTTLMLSVWVSTFLMTSVFYGIYCIVQNQQKIYNKFYGVSHTDKIKSPLLSRWGL